MLDYRQAGEINGYLAMRECTLGDLAVAAHLSALDYFGEVPWTDYPQPRNGISG